MATSYTPRIISTEIVNSAYAGQPSYAVFTIPSASGTAEYRVDTTNRRCSCKGWVFAKINPATGRKNDCKHLRSFGYSEDTVRV